VNLIHFFRTVLIPVALTLFLLTDYKKIPPEFIFRGQLIFERLANYPGDFSSVATLSVFSVAATTFFLLPPARRVFLPAALASSLPLP